MQPGPGFIGLPLLPHAQVAAITIENKAHASLRIRVIIQFYAPMARTLAGAYFALAVVLVGGIGSSAASTADVFGLGSQATALAGAVTARATDFSAAFYNPAGLALGGGREVAFGFTGYASRLA